MRTDCRVGLIAVAALLAACGQPRVEPVNPGLPVVVRIEALPPAPMSVPAVQMRDAVRAAYRLSPDARFLLAAGEIHRLLTGAHADTVRVRWSDSAWTVEYGADTVGVLPDLPGYGDGTRFLLRWASRVLAQHPLAAGEASPALLTADTLFGRFTVPDIAQGLEAVDAVWRKSHDPNVLPRAALGLAELALQVPRVETAADPLVARSLAASMVALAAGKGGAVLRTRALLAYRMGYVTEARHLADSLPPLDATRLLVQRDSAALHAAAIARHAPELTQFLYLLQLVADGSEPRVAGWVSRHYQEVVPSGVRGAELAVEDFATDEGADVVPVELAIELHQVTHRRTFRERLVDAFPFLPVAEFAAVDWMRATSPVDSGGGRLFQQFETDLLNLDSVTAGPFLDRDVFATYFRAQLHFAFERTCIHYVDGLSSARAARDFSSRYREAPLGLWADATQWCHHRSTMDDGGTTALDLVSDLATLRGISSPAVATTTDDIDRRTRYLDSSDVLATRAVFRRFDSRPDQLHNAALLVWEKLRDVPLSERLHRRTWEEAAADFPYFAVWEASYLGDTVSLAAQAADRDLDLGARRQAMLDRFSLTHDTAAVIQEQDRLIAENPDDWPVRREFIAFLERHGRPDVAARVAKDWLDAIGHGPSRGFDYIAARTALARQLQRLGRPREALPWVEPLARTYQLGAMQRTSLIYLDLKRVAEAESLARLIVERYPDSPHGRITLAEALWTQARWGDAAGVLVDQRYVISQTDWRDALAPAFVFFFSHRPVAVAESALVALRALGVGVENLQDFTTAAHDSSYHQLAFALNELTAGNGGDAARDLTSYRYMVDERGVGAAQEWLRSRWGQAGARRNSLEVFRRGEYDLLWVLGAVPDNGPEGSYLWLMRALGWLEDPKHDATQRAALVAHFSQRDPRYYHIAGRFLMGMETEATLLAFADNAHHRCEIAYDLGIKALSEGRYADGSDWLRVTVELRNEHDWEQLWAKDLLTRLTQADRPLAVAVPKVLATKPHW